jgi:hypothetical protein
MGEVPRVRELRNVRELPQEGPLNGPQEGATTPLTAEEELRCRAVFVAEIGALLARQGWATFPAYTPEERIRLFAVARTIEERLGCRVEAVPQDMCSMRFTVVGAGGHVAAVSGR